MTTVKSAIKFLQTLEPDEHIMLCIYTKSDGDLVRVGEHGISPEAWRHAVELASKWGIGNDETFIEAVNVASALSWRRHRGTKNNPKK